jgi:hypothetical protein
LVTKQDYSIYVLNYSSLSAAGGLPIPATVTVVDQLLGDGNIQDIHKEKNQLRILG